MLIVQQISIRWGKEARGPENAARINAQPCTLPLPVAKLIEQAGNLLWHRVRPWGFRYLGEQWESVSCSTFEEQFRVENLELHREGQGIKVCFCPWGDQRWPQPKKIFHLQAGQWAQLEHWSRHEVGFDSVWQYGKQISNITLLKSSRVPHNFFMIKKPDFYFYHKTNLW